MKKVLYSLITLLLLLSHSFTLGVSQTRAATPLRIVSLGDSITYLGGFTTRYKNYVAYDLKNYANLVNKGVVGSTSTDLNQALINDQSLRNEITTANIVTLEIGINDFLYTRGTYQSGDCGGSDNQDCLRTMVANFNSNWDSIITTIKSLVPNNSAVRAADIYYPVVGADMLAEAPFNNSFTVLNSYLAQMNQHINEVSPAMGIPVAQVHTVFNGVGGDENPISKGYILPDALHPTDLGAKLIADQFRVLGYFPLLQPCPDVNFDKRVNVIDLMLISQRYGAISGSSNYSEQYDINADGRINIIDLQITSQQVGKICP